MTATASSTPLPAADTKETGGGNRQRQNLEQLARLASECAAQEKQIEQEHDQGLAQEKRQHEQKVLEVKERSRRQIKDVTSAFAKQETAIQTRAETQRQTLEESHKSTLLQLTRSKEQTDSATKKQVEQSAWQAESALVTINIKIDADEQKFKKEYEASLVELKGLAELESAAQQALARYRVPPEPVELSLDDATKNKIAGEGGGREAVVAEYREQTKSLLKELQFLTRPSIMDDVVPLFAILALAAVAAGAGWIIPPDDHTRLIAAGSAAGGAIVVGLVGWLILRLRKRTRVRIQGKALYIPLMQSLLVARHAATLDPAAAAAARARRVEEACVKRDQEVATARERGKSLLVQSAQQHQAAMLEENTRYKNQLAAIEQEKTTALEELSQSRQKKTDQLQSEYTAAREALTTAHNQALETIESTYESQSAALVSRWTDGLRAVQELLALGTGVDPALRDWNSPAWNHWQSPKDFSGQVRFGEMKVDLAQLTHELPKRLALPEPFSVPALLDMPNRASLLVDTDHTGRDAANDLAQMVMSRLLTQIPAGRVKFTIIDPVGLGQSFAGFMHLADHDESLVGSRIWTEKDHIHQRLADLTEHMETVIQKYLRNEYATIDEYNRQAGELAEPFRYLIIADFPTGFETESLRRLSSIALSGPRCGVYTLILRDLRQPLPHGTPIEDILAHSVHLLHKNGQFRWEDKVFQQFPLTIDPPPDEKTLTFLMDKVGRAAKEAKRVEVPFQSIAPANGQFWSQTSADDLRVPIGKTGATRLQSLRLGVGVAQHALVAGKTGSGKSNLMHTIVTNLAMWYSPEEVEFYLVDFKKGVEFKAYVTAQIPHARAIAVESDREFGLSVLQRVDAELTRRGVLFRDAGAQEISAYRAKTGHKLPRTVLLIDEFQEFFSEDDKLSQEAAGLMDRLVRQGRAFGIHLVLGSQTIGGASGLARSTLGQIAVRVALQCTEADSQMILGDNNSAARLLSRPGEAVYNDAGGLVEANSPFQIAFLPDDQRADYLEKVRSKSQEHQSSAPTPIVFEGNAPAPIRKNPRLMALLEQKDFPPPASAIPAYVGEPVAIKDPTAIRFRRQSGANVLLVGQQEESAAAIFSSIAASLAAQQKPSDAIFYLLDGTPADSPLLGLLPRLFEALPHKFHNVALKQTPEAINEIAQQLAQRQKDDTREGPAIYLLILGLQRYRLLRRQEDDFSFRSSGEENAAPKTDKQFTDLLSEGPSHGIHTIIWADTPITLERTLDRGSMRQFDDRILFQMSASDSSNLIDSPLANRLGPHRALLYSEEQGTTEKFRPYQLPDDAWIEFLRAHVTRPSRRPS